MKNFNLLEGTLGSKCKNLPHPFIKTGPSVLINVAFSYRYPSASN